MIGSLLRAAPGGASLLRLRRRGVAAARRRVRPIRPPVHDLDQAAAFSAVPADHPFITGNGIASRCRYVINYDDLTVNPEVENDWWFCRTDFVEYFFAEHEPKGAYVLFSHNSDRPVDDKLLRFLRRRRLRAWLAANVATAHPKLRALPLGIANPRWRHGTGSVLLRVQGQNLPKTQLFDASYEISTFPPAREYCREQTGIEPSERRDFEEYVHGLSSSYFCIAPRGNGIDTHRVWEALYVRTVPVVTRSLLTEQHPDLPLVVLDDWSEFGAIEFTAELYARMWRDWDPAALELDNYLQRVERMLS
jgi:hypothetical protein